MANITSSAGAPAGNQNAAKDNPKGSVIGFRATPEEKDRLERLAAADGLKLSAWLRKRCGL